MQWEITFDEEVPCICVYASGEASVDSFQAILEEISAHPNWRPGMNLLIDGREIETPSVTPAFVRGSSELTLRSTDSIGSGRCAILAESMAGFGMSRMWQTMTKDDVQFEAQIFDSMDEARGWLLEKVGS